MQLYGPPPHPSQLPYPAGLLEVPGAWVFCLVLGSILWGVALWQRRRQVLAALSFFTGQAVLLTMPLAGLLPWAVYGAYPTTDKQGSLLFYLEGVHQHVLAHPLSLSDYAPARLIGVHVGHLWVVELFDLVLPTHAAFTATGLLFVILAGFCAWLFNRELSGRADVALVMAFPYQMGLHLFRDLNWYTVEKAAVFALPLYAFLWLRATRRGGHWRWAAALAVALAAFLNIYLGLVMGLGAGVATLVWLVLDRSSRRQALIRQAQSYALTLALLPPLVLLQLQLLASGPTLASPECFLEARAALDSFTLWPPAWNRLEPWRALNLLALGAAGLAVVRYRKESLIQGLSAVALLFFLVSLGPRVGSLSNPFYMGPWYVLPFFWRISKPEVFFWITWMCILGLGSVGLARLRPRPAHLAGLQAALVLAWLLSVRTHPAFPGFSEYIPALLSEGWEERLLDQRECRLPEE